MWEINNIFFEIFEQSETKMTLGCVQGPLILVNKFLFKISKGQVGQLYCSCAEAGIACIGNDTQLLGQNSFVSQLASVHATSVNVLHLSLSQLHSTDFADFNF